MHCANLLNGIVICKSFLKYTLEKVRMKVRIKRITRSFRAGYCGAGKYIKADSLDVAEKLSDKYDYFD